MAQRQSRVQRGPRRGWMKVGKTAAFQAHGRALLETIRRSSHGCKLHVTAKLQSHDNVGGDVVRERRRVDPGLADSHHGGTHQPRPPRLHLRVRTRGGSGSVCAFPFATASAIIALRTSALAKEAFASSRRSATSRAFAGSGTARTGGVWRRRPFIVACLLRGKRTIIADADDQSLVVDKDRRLR